MRRHPPVTASVTSRRSSGRIALVAVVVSVGALAACATEVVDEAGPPSARYGSADAAAQALTPHPHTVHARYGSADAAAQALTPKVSPVYGSADAIAHRLEG